MIRKHYINELQYFSAIQSFQHTGNYYDVIILKFNKNLQSSQSDISFVGFLGLNHFMICAGFLPHCTIPLHERQEALIFFFSPSLLKRPDSHGTNLGSQRQPVKAHKKFLRVRGGREYPMYLQTLKVMEETRWRGRFQKQQADNGIYKARDLNLPGPITERAERGNRWKMLLRETQNEQNPSVS